MRVQLGIILLFTLYIDACLAILIHVDEINRMEFYPRESRPESVLNVT